jgi:polyphosphate kinase
MSPRDLPEQSWLASREGLLAGAWTDRDLAWLEFNRRVLHEAQDSRTPLLERLKFLAIFSSNLDEFFMKRMGVLRGKAQAADEDDPGARANDAREHLGTIRRTVTTLLTQQVACYSNELLPALREHGIVLASWSELSKAQREELEAFFDANISPALTPLGFDPTHPYPFISNLSTNWGFVLRAPGADEYVPVRVKCPTASVLPQFIPVKIEVPLGERWYVDMEQMIRHNASKLFSGMEIVSASLFRILRNAEIELDDDDSDSVRESVLDALRERRFQPVVRVDFAPGVAPDIRRALMERFELSDDDTYEVAGLIDYTDLFQLASLDIPALRDPHWTPLPPLGLADEDADIFAAIQAGDILVHHPYDSFEASVERFIEAASYDPQTIAIKMTVYRVGDDTPFVRSLIRAAEAGKQVACIVEVKARFDEARNLHWAQELAKVGAHVVYGVQGLKTHTKLALVVRKEGATLRSYAHVGTGNYHVKTARLYTDVGLLTCDPGITWDIVQLFHYFTGRSLEPPFHEIMVAPMNMRERFLELIRREIEHHRDGRPARIIAKLNQVEDIEVSRALSAASQEGVQIDLIVRGFCCLVPGIPGWTENIRVRSIIGRFLEHSRLFYFANGSGNPLDGEYYIGSADWMYRNLSRRVEAASPVRDKMLRERLWEILDVNLRDRRQAWEMQRDASYVQLQPGDGGATGAESVGSHNCLMDIARRRITG